MQRRALLTALTALCAAAAFAVGATAVDDVVDSPSSGGVVVPPGNGSLNATGGAGGGGGQAGGGCSVCGLSARGLVGSLLPAVSPLVLVGLAAVVVAAAVLFGLRPRQGGSIGTTATAGERVSAGGSDDASGPAVSDAAATNDVYRAWTTLTDGVDVETPATTTPREYARAAVAAGLDRDAVETVRALFTAVRYGDTPVTDERERTARDAVAGLDAATNGGESSTGETNAGDPDATGEGDGR